MPVRILCLLIATPGVLWAQGGAVRSERADFLSWLQTSAVSPYAAVYHQLLGDDLVFGPEGRAPLTDAPPATLSEGRFRISLETEDRTRTVPRHRAVELGDWQLRVSGSRGRTTVTVFRPLAADEVDHPGWYDYDPAYAVEGALEPPEERETRRMLGLDGVEVEASRAGTFVTQVAGTTVRLIVYRIPILGSDESELSIFFRDLTNGDGTYPPGRFITLVPRGEQRYRADFNRARNPFCAYNSVFPCPLPWRGNTIEARVEAGERYDGGGLEFP